MCVSIIYGALKIENSFQKTKVQKDESHRALGFTSERMTACSRVETIHLWVDTSSTAMGVRTTSVLKDLEVERRIMHVLV